MAGLLEAIVSKAWPEATFFLIFSTGTPVLFEMRSKAF